MTEQGETILPKAQWQPISELPLVHEISPMKDVQAAVSALSHLPHLLLLESTRTHHPLGRYSFLMADPFAYFEYDDIAYGTDPFAEIRKTMQPFLQTDPGAQAEALPPFQGGAAGLLSYELGQAWEQIPIAAADEFQLPLLAVGIYDWVLAWDHHQQRCWMISQGYPETEPERRKAQARLRLEFILQQFSHNKQPGKQQPDWQPLRDQQALVEPALVEQYPLPGTDIAGLTSNFRRENYLAAVQQVIDYIYAGDIFQANLSQRLLAPQPCSSLELYNRLRKQNPAPFAGYLAGEDWAIASASPERFINVQNRIVETRPIKGTRQRRSLPEADLFSRDELRESEKDRAENVMIVDLLRNDLSRVCRPGSLTVPALCRVEEYETVSHLVSVVYGHLEEQYDLWDLLAAVFPGGSITGAPKIRAMEIIAELEPTVRGPYCGSLFYSGFDGTTDSNILIRTFTCKSGWVQCPVGGGVIAQSSPVLEYEETLHKAEGMLRALRINS